MNSLRIENKDIYRIEVNDNGDFIEFDVNDISNSIKLINALDEIKEIEKEYKLIYEEIKKEIDETMKNKNIIEYDSEIYGKIARTENEMFAKMRSAIDKVLGKNACQKIFGDKNYYNMFNDLFEELSRPREELNGKSHLDMISMTREQTINYINKKYSKDEQVAI